MAVSGTSVGRLTVLQGIDGGRGNREESLEKEEEGQAVTVSLCQP